MVEEIEISNALVRLGIAFVLGALVGLQREKSQSKVAGVRTFPLLTVLGTVLGFFPGYFAAVGLAAVVTLCVLVNFVNGKQSMGGITTEVAVLLMYSVGVFLASGPPIVAVVLAGSTAILLQLKPELHHMTHTLEQKDIRAIMRFVLIAAVILPIMPDKVIGPFEVLNPHNIWKMVTLVVAINLSGYLVYRFVGTKAGTLLSGIFGGIISSTATTLSESKLAARNKSHQKNAAIVILIASTIMYYRVMIEVGVIARSFLLENLIPLVTPAGVSTLTAVGAWLFFREKEKKTTGPESPEGFKAALVFGFLYALIGLAIGLANRYLGKQSLLWVAGVSGLTDVDAVTLSASQMVSAGEIDPDIAWKLILIASLSNSIFKLGIAGVVGGGALLLRVLLLFAPAFLAGLLVLLFG